jgi:predicted O-methyltransferase YrrM
MHVSRREWMLKALDFFKGPINALEIGTWFGTGSTQLWLDHLHEGSTLTLVDMWGAKQSVGSRNLQMRDHPDSIIDDAFQSTYNKIKEFESKDKDIRINMIRAQSKPFLSELRSNHYDFVYVDGGHRYDEAQYDIQEGKRILKTDGGIICGDDYELFPSEGKLSDMIANKNVDTAPHHPGVSMAIYDEFAARVNVVNGFWWVFTHQGQFTRSFGAVDDNPLPSVF